MLDDEFNEQRSILIRDLADKADDPFIKRRLLDLVFRYEKRPAKTQADTAGVAELARALCAAGRRDRLASQYRDRWSTGSPCGEHHHSSF
ncbi:hypothetical protein [Bradyrhizobium sp. CCBAU 51753]|uniref:hypothetical protein n=1 Tax=Bradyrhizobium sp. CCBAU 51753 TaxID=1325100 RepID=UPI00188B41E0|nr:hypothetical protein [Bradyrhizobium sp. CCBAU 51753]QOZ24132.1 hypothetical protein XH93_11520 [Bradyrhizobium sp. CCBAU 51753]